MEPAFWSYRFAANVLTQDSLAPADLARSYFRPEKELCQSKRPAPKRPAPKCPAPLFTICKSRRTCNFYKERKAFDFKLLYQVACNKSLGYRDTGEILPNIIYHNYDDHKSTKALSHMTSP